MIRQNLLDRFTIIESCGSKVAQRNIITKTFFNYSYKKYHFYFGINMPCSHTDRHSEILLKPQSCKCLAPFVMSDYRRACVKHQAQLFKFDTLKNIKKPK